MTPLGGNDRTDDPGLPIKFGPCSNGEYIPAPLSTVEREAITRARRACDENARRAGMSRPDFLRSVCGAATTLLSLQSVWLDVGRPALGGFWDVPADGALDPDAARTSLAGKQFVLDVQGHRLEYHLMPKDRHKPFFGSVFPQVNCGKDDPHACFSREVFLEDFFLRSDTNMVTLSALPIAPKGSPLSAAIMDETRHTAELTCGWETVLLHAQVLTQLRAAEGEPGRNGAERPPLPDQGMEGVHALPGCVWRSRQRLAARRRRPAPTQGRTRVHREGTQTRHQDDLRPQGLRRRQPLRLPRRRARRRPRLPRPHLHRLPLRLRTDRPARRPLHKADRTRRHQPADHGGAQTSGPPKPERLRRARLDLVDDHA
jgi:hypothetical protein